MRITYDSDADAAYIYLTDEIVAGTVKRTEVADVPSHPGSFNFDFDADGRLLGIEVLAAGNVLSEVTLQDAADITDGA